MYIKIYFNEKPLFLCDKIDEETEPFIHHDDAVFIDELDIHTVKTMIHEMETAKVHAGVFYYPDIDELKKIFFKKFTLVKAGGGLVRNENEEYLLILRRGKWDLPKGKLDDGETIEDCAVREVQEETGLKKVTLKSPLLITYHTYHEGTKYILKETHWFRMKASADEELTPQTTEDIEELKWVTARAMPSFLENTFPSIRDVLKTGLPE